MILKKSVCFLVSFIALVSCSQGEVSLPVEKEVPAFFLRCSIPDKGVSTRGYVEATPNENWLGNVSVLFFEDDAQGNGVYVGQSVPTLSSLGDNYDKLPVSLPAGAEANKRYRLLVVGNVTVPNDAALRGKRQGEVRNTLKYSLTEGYNSLISLPMSGEAVLEAGAQSVPVSLFRRVCRIDLKLMAGQKMTFRSAILYNVRPNLYLFSSRDDRQARIKSASYTSPLAVYGFYAGENYEAVDLLNNGLCLIVNISDSDIHGVAPLQTWYRIDINVDAAGVQQLLANHVYTLTINNITGTGYSTPEYAYQKEEPMEIEFTSDISGWKSVNVPTIPLD